MAKFYVCDGCKNLVMFLGEKSGCTPVCCGEQMKELVPNTVEAAFEKHIPVVKEEGGKVFVQVGEVAHPMMEAHYIEWVYLLTDKGEQIHRFRPGDAPNCVFHIGEEEVVIQVLAYCNLHGLWAAKLD